VPADGAIPPSPQSESQSDECALPFEAPDAGVSMSAHAVSIGTVMVPVTARPPHWYEGDELVDELLQANATHAHATAGHTSCRRDSPLTP
jgi:hypothetical protein